MLFEPEEWQQAEREFHEHNRRSYRREEITQWVFFSLLVKELRQQNELIEALKEMVKQQREAE